MTWDQSVSLDNSQEWVAVASMSSRSKFPCDSTESQAARAIVWRVADEDLTERGSVGSWNEKM